MPHKLKPQTLHTARKLREQQTEAESLLWSVLRGRRLCGLKFRRQHPIEPFYADFACVEQKLIVEIDGGYHDYTFQADASRQAKMENEGWEFFRVSTEDVLEDLEAVARGIAGHLGLTPEFKPRQ